MVSEALRCQQRTGSDDKPCDGTQVKVDSTQSFESGIYDIFFEAKNPSKRLPNDNTWMTALIYKETLLFTHVQPGYAFGEPSPFVIGLPFGTEALAFLSRLGLVLACVLSHT